MKPLIVANWKCNPTSSKKAERLFCLIEKGIKNIKGVDVVVCPPLLYLLNLKSLILNLKLGAQDVFWENKGAYTGEVSPLMLKDAGCKYVIVGHSERRKYFQETDEIINKKVRAVLEAKLSPILCVGETEKQKNKKETSRVLKKQIEVGLKGISIPQHAGQNSKFSVAYEPVWAIGSGNPCDVEEAKKINLLIKKIVSGLYGSKIAKKIQVLYGGSVNKKNAVAYTKKAGFDGLLVGGASLKSGEFIKIIESVI